MQNKNNKGALGDVKYSILPEMLFQKINGDGWILADGRPINGSDLHELTSMEKAPDARGLFLRALNCNKTENAYDTERKVGEFQDDNTRLPRNNAFGGITALDGNHQHDYTHTSYNVIKHRKGTGSNLWTCHYHNAKTGGNASHQHHLTINSGGDSETRPKNMAFYVYIKINY